MKGFRLTAAVLLVFLTTAGISSLSADTYYLAEQVRVGREVQVNDLLLIPSHNSLGQLKLTLETEGRLVYLNQKGLSASVPGGFPGALIGTGIWLIPEDFTSVENKSLGPLLKKIELLVSSATEKNVPGFSILEDDIARLSLADEIRQSRRGSDLILETGNRNLEAVTVDFIEAQDQEARRVPAGTRITLYISRKGLIITAEGRTNRGASVGERVPVTLTNTRRRVEALLTGSDEGEVRF